MDAYLEALRVKPQTARELAKALGRNTDRSTVASIRHTLERMERKGLVQRTLPAFQGAWVWEAAAKDLTAVAHQQDQPSITGAPHHRGALRRGHGGTSGTTTASPRR